MFPFDGKYLKVLTPRTIDGTTPQVNEDTNQAEFRETHLPLTARKYLEHQNNQLPKHLRSKIVEIDSDSKPDAEAQKVIDDKLPPKKQKKESDDLIK